MVNNPLNIEILTYFFSKSVVCNDYTQLWQLAVLAVAWGLIYLPTYLPRSQSLIHLVLSSEIKTLQLLRYAGLVSLSGMHFKELKKKHTALPLLSLHLCLPKLIISVPLEKRNLRDLENYKIWKIMVEHVRNAKLLKKVPNCAWYSQTLPKSPYFSNHSWSVYFY